MGLIRGGFLRAGRRFADNIDAAAHVVPLNSSGNFGFKSAKKGSRARVFESNNPARTAYEFQLRAARGFVTISKIRWGMVMTMRDGTVITYRMRSSSKDRTPTVQLNVMGMPGVKDQKIHFVPRGSNVRR